MFTSPTQKCTKTDSAKPQPLEPTTKRCPKQTLLEIFRLQIQPFSDLEGSRQAFGSTFNDGEAIERKIRETLHSDRSYTQETYSGLLADFEHVEEIVGGLLRTESGGSLEEQNSDLCSELLNAFIDTSFQVHLFSLMCDVEPGELDPPEGVFAEWSAKISEFVEMTLEQPNPDQLIAEDWLHVRYYSPSGSLAISKRMKGEKDHEDQLLPFEDLTLHKFGYSSHSKYSSAELVHSSSSFLNLDRQNSNKLGDWHHHSDFSTNEEESTDTPPLLLSPCLQSSSTAQNRPNLLLRSLQAIEEFMCMYLQIVNLILGAQAPGVAKLATYTHLWSKYTDTILCIDEQCRFIDRAMNNVMKHHLPQYPNYPNYSLWRLMLVYNQHRPSLDPIFFKCLLNHRVESMRNMAAEEPFQAGEKFARSVMMRNLRGCKPDLDRDNCFDTQLGEDSALHFIKAYARSVVDISLTEVSIQAKNHTEVQMERSYTKLESRIVRQSEALFLKLNPVQFGFDVFQRFLSVDSMVLSDIFLERTYLKCVQRIIKVQLEQIQLQVRNHALGSTKENSPGLAWRLDPPRNRAPAQLSLPFDVILGNGSEKDRPLEERSSIPNSAQFQDLKLSIFKMTQDDPSSEDDFVPPPTKKSNSSGAMNLKKCESLPRIGCESLKSNRSSKRELLDLVRSKRGLSGHESKSDETTISLQDLRAELVKYDLTAARSFYEIRTKVRSYE